VYAPNIAEPLDVQVEMIGGEGRIREEELVLRSPVDSCSNAALIELEHSVASR
jgi:hypothetical protein